MYEKYVKKLEKQELSSIPFHFNSLGIERLVAKEFPVHLAIHEINQISEMPTQYCELHKHNNPEINIILPKESGLIYDIILGKETYRLEAPYSIWIPEKILHSANVVKGSGYFICMILQDKYKAEK